MEAHDYLLGDVLSGNRQFLVPIYQRRYQWTEAELLPFWSDVAAKADEVLEDRATYQHYLGALIWVASGDGLTTKLHVVDGQQRLTTIQLFLAALREVAIARSHIDISLEIEPYIFNSGSSIRTSGERAKMVPTPADRYIVQDIITSDRASIRRKYSDHYFQNGNLKTSQAPRALTNYIALCKLIERYGRTGEIDDQSGDVALAIEEAASAQERSRLCALLEAILRNLKIVVIALGDGDDAQVIFETLNSKGKPLLAMDLVKNNIFHRAESQGEAAADLYRELWSAFDGDFWTQPAPRARPIRPRIDHFLSHSLSAQTGKQTAIKELYAEYRGFSRPPGGTRFVRVEDELRALTQYTDIYKVLEGETPGRTALSWVGVKLAAWESSIAYPVIFQVAASDLTESQKAQAYRLIYSYIVRRAVCGLPNKSHGVVFSRLATRILAEGASPQIIGLVFSESASNTSRFPDDAEFTRSLVQNPIYRWFSASRLPDLLWELELASRSSFTEAIGRPDSLWVEHILPQSWTDEWPDAEGRLVRRDGGEQSTLERSDAIHTLGNLTLTTDKLNISLGNESFARKLAKLQKESLFVLNHELQAHSSWAELEITLRAKRLAELACVAFPSAASVEIESSSSMPGREVG